jgi:hypothetical protein
MTTPVGGKQGEMESVCVACFAYFEADEDMLVWRARKFQNYLSDINASPGRKVENLV